MNNTLQVIAGTQQGRYRGLSSRYGRRGLSGLADAVYNPANGWIINGGVTDAEAREAITLWKNGQNVVGTWDTNANAAVVRLSSGLLVALTDYIAGANRANTTPTEVTFTTTLPGGAVQQVTNRFNVTRIYKQGTSPLGPSIGGATNPNPVSPVTQTSQASPDDCPPRENCTEKWIDKTMYVSAKASSGAIPIPIAFEKLVCEGESDAPPEIDCEEFLRALTQASSGNVPTLNGLGIVANDALVSTSPLTVPPSMPPALPTTPQTPSWCKNCTKKLVKATAYASDTQTEGSFPFNVKLKVLVCETNAKPKIDCDEVVKALQSGLAARRSGVNGLMGLYGLSNATTGTGAAGSGLPATVDPATFKYVPEPAPEEAGMSWLLIAALVGTGIYAMTR